MPDTNIITWDEPEKRTYETGVDHGVLYTGYQNDGSFTTAEAWNGLTNVNENPSGAEETALWADNMKYLSIRSAENFGLTIEAYTYPDTFAECDGSKEVVEGVKVHQQTRKTFGFSYRTIKGNDVLDNDYGYLLHLVYNCTASPSQRGYQTVNESPEAITFSWEVTTTGAVINSSVLANAKPTALVTIDSTKVDATKLKALEDVLYGTSSTAAKLPDINTVLTTLK